MSDEKTAGDLREDSSLQVSDEFLERAAAYTQEMMLSIKKY
jgi:hypothetical protein